MNRAKKWRIGDKGYEVEWVKDDTPEDRDNWITIRRLFKTRAEAMAYAQRMLPEARRAGWFAPHVVITPFVIAEGKDGTESFWGFDHFYQIDHFLQHGRI